MKLKWTAAAVAICLFLGGCSGGEGTKGQRDFIGASTSLFQSIEVENGTPVTAEFEVSLSETEAAFLFVEVSEQVEGEIRYTYTTGDKPGVILGYGLEGSGECTVFDLVSATDAAYGTIWVEEKVTLQPGMNQFYLAGDSVSCRMRLELDGLEEGKVSYVSAFPKAAD